MKKSIRTKKKKTATRTTKSKVVVPIKPTKLPKPVVPTEPLALTAADKFPGEELVPDKLKLLFRLWHKGMKDGSLREAAAENGAHYLSVLLEENQKLRNENAKLLSTLKDIAKSHEQLEKFRAAAEQRMDDMFDGLLKLAKDRDTCVDALNTLHKDILSACDSSTRRMNRATEQFFSENAIGDLAKDLPGFEQCDDCDCDGDCR